MEYQNKTTLVSLNDSLLQCLNTKSMSQDDIVVYQVKNILEQNGRQNILPIDCGSLFLNKQHNITEFLKNNLSLDEIRATQQTSIDAARHGLAKYFVSEKLKGYYTIGYSNDKIHISDAIKESENVGVLLSCVANDMMSSIWVNPISHMIARIPFMDKSILKRTKILLKDKRVRNKIVDGLKINMEQLLGINDNSKICTFGIYRPQILPKDFELIFDEINNRIIQTTKEYQQSYIDINDIKSKPIDFHPNKKGYEIISGRIANMLQQRFSDNQPPFDLNIPNFGYQDLGLDGAISDTRKYMNQERTNISNFVNYIKNNHGYTQEQILETMSGLISGRKKEVENMEQVYNKAKTLIRY